MRVILDSMMKITEADKGVIQEIKEQLTFSNEKYIQAQKYSKYPVRNIPQFIHYYSHINGGIAVPRGFKLNLDNCIVEDRRIENTVKYPKCKIKLREDQNEALTKYLDDPDKGLILLQTGKGKSILGLYIAYALKQKTLIVVHKSDLIDGWNKDAKMMFDDIECGLIKAKKRKVGEQITLATIQTLNRLTEEELENLYKEFGCVIVDEVHVAGAKQYDLINNFEGAYRIGLTATLERSDKLDTVLHYIFGGVAYSSKITKDDKDILPVSVQMKAIDIDYNPKCHFTGRNYVYVPFKEWGSYTNLVDLDKVPQSKRPQINYHDITDVIVENSNYINTVVRDVRNEVNKGRKCLLVFTKKHHIDLYYDLFSNYYPKDKLTKYYGDNKDKIEVMKAKAEQSLITLATYSIVTEGTNVKSWQSLFLVSSINNAKNTEQVVGRIRRIDGIKDRSYVYDYFFPRTIAVARHHYTRITRYKKLLFDISYEEPYTKFMNKKANVFSRGF